MNNKYIKQNYLLLFYSLLLSVSTLAMTSKDWDDLLGEELTVIENSGEFDFLDADRPPSQPFQPAPFQDEFIKNLQSSHGGFKFNTLSYLRLVMAFSAEELLMFGIMGPTEKAEYYDAPARTLHEIIEALMSLSAAKNNSLSFTLEKIASFKETILNNLDKSSYQFNPTVLKHTLHFPCRFCKGSPIHIHDGNVSELVHIWQNILEDRINEKSEENKHTDQDDDEDDKNYYTLPYLAIEYYTKTLLNILPDDATILFLGRTPIPIFYVFEHLQNMGLSKLRAMNLKQAYFSDNPDGSFFDDEVFIVDSDQVRFYFDYLKNIKFDQNLKELFIVDIVLTGYGLESFTAIFNAFWVYNFGTVPPKIITCNLAATNKKTLQADLPDNVSVYPLIAKNKADIRNHCALAADFKPHETNNDEIYTFGSIFLQLADILSEEVGGIYFPCTYWAPQYLCLFDFKHDPMVEFHKEKARQVALKLFLRAAP